MKAITIQQPWANALMFGIKKYETRSWATQHRGIIAIHAGKKRNQKQEYASLGALIYGAILGTAKLIACHSVDDLTLSPEEKKWGNFSPGRFAWEFADITWLIDPLPISGQLGLWNIPQIFPHNWHASYLFAAAPTYS